MKILQINTVCGTGSTGRIATDLYKIYEEVGHECRIAYGRGTAPKGYKTIKIGSKIDNYLHVVKTRVLDKHGFGSTMATKKFIEEVKKYNPDVVHLHNIHGYYINIEILFKYLKETNKKVIWTLHDCWSFTGHCSHFTYVGCDKWKNGCENCEQKAEYPSSKVLDNSKWSYEKKKELFTSINREKLIIVTPSKWLAGLVKESYLKKYKVEVIHNGIDLDVFKPTESDFRERYGIGNKKIILGVASVWTERKGYNYFIELAKELDENYQIVMVGVSEKQKKELPKNIIAITRTNNVKELAEIYSASNVFFNPTLEDNFPTTNLEARACNTPIVTFKTGGIGEVIEENYEFKIKKTDDIGVNLRNKTFNSKYFKLNVIDKNKQLKKYIKRLGK